jgi:hypothetical protein
MSILHTKYLPPFLGLATLTWIVGGTYWYQKQFCEVPATASVALAVKNSGTNLPFYFPIGDSKPVFTSECFVLFKETAAFLNSNQDKILVVKGLTTPQETKRNLSTNLGMARAEAIKSALLTFGALPTSIETKSAQRSNLAVANQQLFDAVEFNMVDNIEGHFQALNLFFQKDKFQFAENDDLKNYFHALNKYMSFHPNLTVKITAHRENTEGVAASKKRLAFIRQFLEKHDFLSKQLAFEDVNSEMPLGEEGHLKNRRVEIRLIVP